MTERTDALPELTAADNDALGAAFPDALTGERSAASECQRIAAALAAPFPASELKWKPQAVSGNRALAVPYISARAVQERLDGVLGAANWRDEYQLLPSGSVVCTLSVRIDGEWIGKVDVGSPSEQPDEGDRVKAAFSDALKRAAVKWSIARYLYALPKQWADYDPHKRQFVTTPTLPASALPPARAKATPANGTPKPATPAPSANGTPKPSPVSGVDGFAARLRKFDERMANAGLCRVGECLRFVQDGAAKAALPANMLLWNDAQQAVAIGLSKQFEAECRKRK